MGIGVTAQRRFVRGPDQERALAFREWGSNHTSKSVFLIRFFQILVHVALLRDLRIMHRSRGIEGCRNHYAGRNGEMNVSEVVIMLPAGHDPNFLDVTDMIRQAWEDVYERKLTRYWLKTELLLRGTHFPLEKIHGKVKGKNWMKKPNSN